MSNTVVRQILIFMTSQESVFLGIIKVSFLKISNFLHWRFEYRSKNKLFQVKTRRLRLIPDPGKGFLVFYFQIATAPDTKNRGVHQQLRQRHGFYI